MIRISVLLMCVSATVACGGADKIGCDWFSGPNCWKESVAAAYQCTTDGERPVLSADRKTCTYTDGTEVRFTAALPDAGGLADYQWEFEIVKGGTACASYRELGSDGDGGFVLTTSLGEFREEVSGTNLVIDCPTGGSVQINAFDAFECDFSQLPGHSAGLTSFTLLGAQGALFSCEQP